MGSVVVGRIRLARPSPIDFYLSSLPRSTLSFVIFLCLPFHHPIPPTSPRYLRSLVSLWFGSCNFCTAGV